VQDESRAATPVPPRTVEEAEAQPDDDHEAVSEDAATDTPVVAAAQAVKRIEKPVIKPKAKTERVGNDPEGYVLPPINLLEANKVRRDVEHELEKVTIGKAIEAVFADFNIEVSVVAAARGPVVTQYEMKLLDSGMRVSKVEGFEKDLAMKLGTEGIRIVAPLPNKTTVGVEVPNKIKEAVVMRELVEAIDPATNVLPMILGRDAVGKPLVTDLSKAPHLLVAGSTGMGKSVCMNAMICSILLFRTPDEVRFIMIDPKMVELAGYEDIPHLLAPPITDMTKAHAALEWACQVMDQRYEALKATGCRNIGDYNQLGIDEIRSRIDKKRLSIDELPEAKDRMFYIVVLVDEYADLMMVNKEVEKSIVRLAAKSRACGIHVILTCLLYTSDAADDM
jgi:S-DNA-T family DNA segregation ATPase FtsK/SpoIIIE